MLLFRLSTTEGSIVFQGWNLKLSIFLPPFKSWSFVLLSSYYWNTTQFNLNFIAWASFAFLLGTFSLGWADKQSHFFFNTELRASRWPEFFVELLFSMTSLSVWLVAANRVSYSVGDNDKIHFLIRYLRKARKQLNIFLLFVYIKLILYINHTE